VDELKNDATKLPPDYMRAIAALWRDPGIQVCGGGQTGR
jgi:hypothetical protein